MTEAPNTARVFELIHLFNEGVQNQESPDALLKRALAAIVACVPGGKAVRVYHLNRDTLSLWASDDSASMDAVPASDDAPLSINTHPVYAVVLRTLSPAHDVDSNRVVFPLQRGTQVFGLVEIDTEERRIDLLPLHAAMNHIALALDNLVLRDLIQRQNQTAHELTNCTSFTDIAGAFARNMLQLGQYIAINLFIHNGDGEFAGFETVATANWQQTFAVHDRIALTLEEFGQLLSRIYDPGIPVLVADGLNETTIHERFRVWLQELNATSFYSIPMWAQGAVIGYIVLAGTTIVDLTHAEMQAFRTLTDQISALVYAQWMARDLDETHLLLDNTGETHRGGTDNRNLFTQTTETLEFVHVQYETITRIHSADNSAQILEALYDFVGTNYNTAQIARIVYPSQPMQAQILAEIDPKGTRLVERLILVSDYEWLEGLPILAETMIPNVATDPNLDDTIRQQLQEAGVLAALNIPLLANDRLTGFLHFTHNEPTRISDEHMRALRSLANQIAIVLENEDLLKQTEDSLSETSALYDVNRSLLEAQGMLDILSAIFRYIAPNSASISYIELQYNKDNVLEALQINHIVTPAGAKTVDNPLQFHINEHIRARLMEHVAHVGNALEILEDVQHENVDHPLASLPLLQGVGSIIIIPILKQDVRIGQIHIVYDKPRAFDTRTQRLSQVVRNQIVIVQQNNDLLRDTQITASRLREQVRIQQTLNQLATVLNSLHDEYTLLSEACQALVTALNIDHAGMTLIDEDGLIATVTGEYPDNGTVGLEIEATGQIWDILRQSTDSIIINDIDNNPSLEPMSRAALQSIGVKSVLFVPINDQNGMLIGSVGLDILTTDKVFDDNMTAIAQTITLQIALGIQNIRLLRETQTNATDLANRVQMLQSLNENVTILNSVRSESALLREVARVLVNTVGVDHVGIAMLDADKKHVTLVTEFPEQGFTGIKINLANDELQARLVKTLRPIVINNLPESSEIGIENRKTLTDVGIQSIMVFPLVDINNQFIGSIGLDIFTEGREFDTEMISLTNTIITQISVSIQNIRLLESVRKQATQLHQITAFSQSMQATLDITDIFRTAIEISRKVIPIDHMSIMIYDTEKAHLQVAAQYSDEGLHLNLDSPKPISEQESVLLTRAWESRAMLHFDDLIEQGGLQHPFDAQMRSALFLPLFSRGLIRGIIEISTRMPGAYSETDITVFRQMINQLAVALENAEAYIQSQQIAKNRTLVNEISGRLQQQISLDSVLDVTVREVGKALGARRGRIQLGIRSENGESTEAAPEE